MKKRFLGKLVVGLGVLLGFSGLALASSTEAEAADMYRLYNPNSGEHFYTANLTEKNKVQGAGWRYEGIGWYAPTSGDPVYRLYNPNAGDHHYTLHLFEKNHLVSVGWRYEGVGWYSDKSKAVPLYRAYNPNAKAGSHNYTVNNNEQQNLLRAGWKNEGIAWYGIT
ncbi:MAG: leucine-rich repeat domain-containing protein, partial [Enterococcus hulanensis]